MTWPPDIACLTEYLLCQLYLGQLSLMLASLLLAFAAQQQTTTMLPLLPILLLGSDTEMDKGSMSAQKTCWAIISLSSCMMHASELSCAELRLSERAFVSL